MENKKIINYENLEFPIKSIETILDAFDQEEKALILKFVTQRFAARKQKQQLQENVEGVNLSGLLKKIMKGDKDERKD